MRSIQVLRNFCIKAGIQVKSKDYKLSEQNGREPFTSDDVSDVFPIIKSMNPKTSDGQELAEVGRQLLSKYKLDVAFEILNECLAIFHQVYGPLHAETANCYSNLALVLFHAADLEQAINHQKRAVIITERVLGLDHLETIQGYGSLAMYYQAAGRHREALCAMKRSYYLSKLVSGTIHPDFAGMLTHLGVMYQELGNASLSLHFQLEALKCNEFFYGQVHMSTAVSCHNAALAYHLMERYKEAIVYEKRNLQILGKLVGAQDYRTVESSVWLKQMSAKLAQQEAQTQTQRIKAAGGQKESRGGKYHFKIITGKV